MNNPKTKQLQVRVPPATHERLRTLAFNNRRSMNGEINRALDLYLDQDSTPARKPGRPSLQALIDRATSWPGDVWRPLLVVTKEEDGWHWADKAKGACGVGDGPFDTERATWQDIVDNYVGS